MKHFLRGRVGLGMTRPRHIRAIVEPLQEFPAALLMYFLSELVAHPLRDFGTGPQPAIGCWPLQRSVKFGELLGREK